MHGLSLVLVSLGYYTCGARDSHCNASLAVERGLASLAVVLGILTAMPLLLWSAGSGAHRLQQLRRMGSVARWHVEPSWTRDQTHVPWIGRQIRYHWIIREVHLLFRSPPLKFLPTQLTNSKLLTLVIKESVNKVVSLPA